MSYMGKVVQERSSSCLTSFNKPIHIYAHEISCLPGGTTSCEASGEDKERHKIIGFHAATGDFESIISGRK